jgi:GTP-binding protein
MFADNATIEVKAGKGGDGRLSFRHEKYRAMGGPDGGDGGRGGDIIFEADHNQHTLSAYRTQRKIQADDGNAGGENRKRGHGGEDAIISVPPGTIIRDGERVVADLTESGQRIVVAYGGRGGFGNAHFKSSVRQAPRAAELGEPGEAYVLSLELKLVADVGLIGLPNAGKSTLLSVISNARPEIADYPFTTLVPNLGVVDQDGYGFLVADIPGLIEGASQGKGLGDEFLRHVERTAVLLHLVDADSKDIRAAYDVIQGELAAYAVDLSDRPQIIALTKAETVLPEQITAAKKALKKSGREVFVISSQAHQGLTELLRRLNVLVREAHEAREIEAAKVLPVIDETSLPDSWKLEPEEDGIWRLTGDRLEGFARRTNFDNDAGVDRLRDILRRSGVARQLRRQVGHNLDELENNPIIRIGEAELEWK